MLIQEIGTQSASVEDFDVIRKELNSSLEAALNALKDHIENVEDELAEAYLRLFDKLKEYFDIYMQAKIDQLQPLLMTEIDHKIDNVNANLNDKINGVDANANARISDLESAVNGKIADLENDTAGLQNIKANKHTRTLLDNGVEQIDFPSTVYPMNGSVSEISVITLNTDANGGLTFGKDKTPSQAEQDIKNFYNPLIPAQASASNKLATVDFVNSSIAQVAANRVAYTATGDPFPSRQALLSAITVYHNGAVYTPKLHDYCIVSADEEAPDPWTDGQTRMEYAGGQWEFAYGINNRPFTDAENKTLASGATAEIIGKAVTALQSITAANGLAIDAKNGNIQNVKGLDATATQKGVTLLGAANGAARYGNKSDAGLSNVDNLQQATKTEFSAHVNNKANPHEVTKAQIGLGNVLNVDATNASNLSGGTLPIARLADESVTKAKLAAAVQASLNKADTALQSVTARYQHNIVIPLSLGGAAGGEIVFNFINASSSSYTTLANLIAAMTATGIERFIASGSYSSPDANRLYHSLKVSSTTILQFHYYNITTGTLSQAQQFSSLVNGMTDNVVQVS